MPTPKSTIVVCAQNAMTRAGLASMAASSATTILGKLSNLSALNHWLQTEIADLVLIDFSDATVNSIEELAQIIEGASPEEAVPVLLLRDSGLFNDHELVQQMQARLLSTGLASILPTTISENELKAAIAAITKGLVILHPEITDSLFDTSAQFLSSSAEPETPIEPLTPRETEVLNQLADGLTNKAIAQNLNISEHTVKFHLSTVLSKLAASSRTEAVAIGIRAGLVRL